MGAAVILCKEWMDNGLQWLAGPHLTRNGLSGHRENSIIKVMKSKLYLKHLRKGDEMQGIAIAVKVGEVTSF